MAYEDRHKELEQYLTSGEPGVEERARNRSTTIGSQDIDSLRQSEFLHKYAKTKIVEAFSSLRTRIIDNLYCTNFHGKSSATNPALTFGNLSL